MVCHHPAKFGSHRYCSSRGIIFLICRLIKQNHVIKRSAEYNDRCHSSEVITLLSLEIIGTVVGEI